MSEYWCDHGFRNSSGCRDCKKAFDDKCVFVIVPYRDDGRYEPGMAIGGKLYQRSKVAQRACNKLNEQGHAYVVRSFLKTWISK